MPTVDPSLEPVGLAVAIDACLAVTHGRPKSFADSSMVLRPVDSLNEQVQIASAVSPSAVFALDGLFWAGYGPAENFAERSERVRRCCELLERFKAPVVVGDLPDMRGSVARYLGDNSVPSEPERVELNRQIEMWAATQPNVLVLSLSRLVDDVRKGVPVGLGVTEVDPKETPGLFLSDGLHVSSDGEIALATISLSAFVAAGGLPPSGVYRNLDASRANLARLRRENSDKQRALASERRKRDPSGNLERQRRALDRGSELIAAAQRKDADAVIALVGETFDVENCESRNSADAHSVAIARVMMPEVGGRIEAAALAAVERVGTDAPTETIVNAIEFAIVAKRGESAGRLIDELARRAAKDGEHGTKAEVPTSVGYAHRIYEWFIDDDPVQVVRLFTEVRSASKEIVARAKSTQATLKFAKSAGFESGRLRAHTPAEELRKFAAALGKAGRTADAELVTSIAVAEE